MVYSQEKRDFNEFIELLREQDKQFQQKAQDEKERPRDLREKLCSPSMEPYFEVYAEKDQEHFRNLLNEPHNATYYRMEPFSVTTYPSHIHTVMAYLRGFDPSKESFKQEFKNYWGVETPNELPQLLLGESGLLRERHLFLLRGQANGYEKSEIYKPLFVALYQEWKRNKDIWLPVYANRIEDTLAYEREDCNWQKFKEKKLIEVQGILKGQPGKDPARQVILSKLPPQRFDNFVSERLAWLDLLSQPGEGLGEDLRSLVKDPKVPQEKAEKAAFTFHHLFTSPIFYARKTWHTIDWEYDSKIFGEVLEAIVCHLPPLRDELFRSLKEAFQIPIDLLRGAFAHREEIPEEGKVFPSLRPEVKVIQGHDPRRLLDEICTSGLDKERDQLNKKLWEYEEKLKGSDTHDVELMRIHLEEFYKAFLEHCRRVLQARKEFSFKVEGTVIGIGAGIAASEVIAAPFLAKLLTHLLVHKGVEKGFDRIERQKLDHIWDEEPQRRYPYITYMAPLYLIVKGK